MCVYQQILCTFCLLVNVNFKFYFAEVEKEVETGETNSETENRKVFILKINGFIKYAMLFKGRCKKKKIGRHVPTVSVDTTF